MNNTITGDANSNYVSDAGDDVGGVMQWDLTIPATGSSTVNLYVTYGLGTDLAPNSWTNPKAGVKNWETMQ